MPNTMKSRLFFIALVAFATARAATAQEPPAAPDNATALAEFARGDAVVAAALDLPRDTPAQQLRTILALVDLGRSDVAALLAPELLAAELDDDSRAELVGQFGSARFMQLIRLDSPGLDGAPSELTGMRDFAQQCLDAAAAAARDPARLAALIEQLNAPGEDDRYAARVDLRATGDAGIIAVTSALAKAQTPAARGNLLAALAEMRPAVDTPLIALLAEGRGQLRADAATLAGKLRMREAIPWLAALAVSNDPAAEAAWKALGQMGLPAPSSHEALLLIGQRLADVDSLPLPPDDEPRDSWWTWDELHQTLAVSTPSPRESRASARARFARALRDAGGFSNPTVRRTALIEIMEEIVVMQMAADATEDLTAMSSIELNETLALAVEKQRFGAAVRLAAELGERKDAGVLATATGRPSPLAEALTSSHRPLRYAALKAVMELNPPRTFPGASYVPKALWYFAAGAGDPVAVVAAPVFPRSSDWAGQLRGLGYEAMPVGTGRDAIAAALDTAVSPRLGVILLDGDVGLPLVREVIFQLRSAVPTARVPIIVASSTEGYADAQRLAAEDPLLLAAPRPHGDGALATLVERAQTLSPDPLAKKTERDAQAGQALDWIAKLIAADAPYDELRRDGGLTNRSLFNPDLAPQALRVLAALGTAESQSTLLDYASGTSVPIESRRAAVEALAANFKQFGIQLTTDQLRVQYDRYNASETADADTQQVLGSILDLIEKKDETTQPPAPPTEPSI
jgi:hypothetical protein